MSAVDTQFYQNKKKSSFFLSLGFFILSLVITGGLFLYNNSLIDDNDALNGEIQNLEAAIEETRSQPNIQAYSIYERHAKILETMQYQSQIPLFVTHLKKAFLRYRVQATWFSYTDGEVTTDIATQTNDSSPAYAQISNFIEWYRTDEDSLFDLLPIERFEGYDRVSSQAVFNLK